MMDCRITPGNDKIEGRFPMPISQQIKDLIATAWADGYPCLVATVGPKGPNISPKGSLVVFDDQHLAYSRCHLREVE
jgi:hypothetical protein